MTSRRSISDRLSSGQWLAGGLAAVVVVAIAALSIGGHPSRVAPTSPGRSKSFQAWLAQADHDCRALGPQPAGYEKQMFGDVFNTTPSSAKRASDLRRLAALVRAEVGPPADYPTDPAEYKRASRALAPFFAGVTSLNQAADDVAGNDGLAAALALRQAGGHLETGAANLARLGAPDCS